MRIWNACLILVNFPRPFAHRRRQELFRHKSYGLRELHHGEISCLPFDITRSSFEIKVSSMFYKKVTCYLHRKTWPRRQAPSGSGRYHSHDPVALSGVLTNDRIPISLPSRCVFPESYVYRSGPAIMANDPASHLCGTAGEAVTSS